MVHAKPATGRHFGMEVSDEYILENKMKYKTCVSIAEKTPKK